MFPSWITGHPMGFRESVSALAVRVRSALKEKGGNILLITSSMAGEGKSTVAIDLAEQLAPGRNTG